MLAKPSFGLKYLQRGNKIFSSFDENFVALSCGSVLRCTELYGFVCCEDYKLIAMLRIVLAHLVYEIRAKEVLAVPAVEIEGSQDVQLIIVSPQYDIELHAPKRASRFRFEFQICVQSGPNSTVRWERGRELQARSRAALQVRRKARV